MKQVAFVLLLLASASAWAAEWTRVGAAENEGAVYVDPATMSKTGHLAKMWALYDFSAPRLLRGRGEYRSVKFQNEFDCIKRRFRVLSVSWYAANMGSGEPIYSGNVGRQWTPASSGSADDGLWEAACKQ